MRQTQETQKRSNLKSFVIIGLLLLLVAVIGFGGYTLSKYLTSKSESGTANVAKWGFTVETDATELFGESYKWDGNNSVVGTDGTITVKASTAKQNVVAPGTTGSMTFSVKGTAEVKAQIKIEMSDVKDINLNYTPADGEATDYAPVKWTLNDGTKDLVKDGTLAEVAAQLNAVDETYEAGAADVSKEYTLTWAWAFESGNDAADTMLGALSNNADATFDGYTVNSKETTVAFTLKISVTQLAQ